MLKNKLSLALITGAALLTGLGAGIAGIAGAQTVTTATAPAVTTSTTATSATAPAASHPQGHMPLGKDGIVVSVSGNTVTMTEESDEGGATYTVDASGATVANNGATVALSTLTPGEKVFIAGTVSGTNVTATSVSLGHGMRGGPGGHRPNDGDGDAGDAATTVTSASATTTQ